MNSTFAFACTTPGEIISDTARKEKNAVKRQFFLPREFFVSCNKNFFLTARQKKCRAKKKNSCGTKKKKIHITMRKNSLASENIPVSGSKNSYCS